MNLYIYKYSYKKGDDIDTSFIPSIYRRRLSNFAKLSLCTMNEVYENNDINLVFASNYGNFEKVLKLIEQKNSEGEISPNGFSVSVHNSSVGLFSVLNKIHSSYNSVSAGENSFSAGLIESIITEGDVLYCFTEEVGEFESIALLMGSKPKEGAVKIELKDAQKSLKEFRKLL